jgi:hypothetical protein
MPLIRRHVEWSATFLIPGRHGRATFNQETHYFELPKPRCQAQGSLLLVVPAVNICTVIDQQLCGVEVPNVGREMQRSPAIFSLCIHIGAAVYQEPCEVKVSIP